MDEQNWALTTPNYPTQNYQKNLNCNWTLTSSPGRKIILEPFQINIEKCPLDDTGFKCTCDFLAIKTSKEEISNKNSFDKKFCGKDVKVPKIETKENVLFLHFHSDETHVFQGLKIKYRLK